jgi:hypothetical protein
MSKSPPHLPATAFPTPDYDHPRYATPARTPDTTRTIDPMRSVDIGVPRRPRRPRRLPSHLGPSSAPSTPIYTMLTTHDLSYAHHPPLPFPIAHDPVFAFSRATSNYLAARRLFLPCTTNTTRTTSDLRHAPTATCVTVAVAVFHRPRRLCYLAARGDHLPRSPGLTTWRARLGASPAQHTPPPLCPATDDRHSRLHTPSPSPSSVKYRLRCTTRAPVAASPIRPDYLRLAQYLRQSFTVAHATFVAHPLRLSLYRT